MPEGREECQESSTRSRVFARFDPRPARQRSYRELRRPETQRGGPGRSARTFEIYSSNKTCSSWSGSPDRRILKTAEPLGPQWIIQLFVWTEWDDAPDELRPLSSRSICFLWPSR